MRPNILLITVDEMRGDCLSVLDHPIVHTPYLDNLARQGVLFSNAYTASPACVPARAALHTGLSPKSHGKSGSKPRSGWDYENYLAEQFTKAGYHTQAVGKMHVSPIRRRCGFDDVLLHDGYIRSQRRKDETKMDDYLPWLRHRAGMESDFVEHGIDCNASMLGRPWHLDETLHPTNWVVTKSIEFLRRRDPTAPYFLFMSFVAPHPPLVPPQPYYDKYIHADIPDCPIGDWADTEDKNRSGLNPTAFSGIVNPSSLREAKAAYYGMITHIDHQIGRMMIAMHELGVLDNTIILFTSDHGDMMGDHNIFRKGVPYEGSAKIPFILHDPTGSLQMKQGYVSDKPVELMDVMPTLLEAADISIPDTVEGSSVLPLGRGENTDWRHYVHGEYARGILPNHYLTNGKEKYIWFTKTGEEQLFNVEQDSQEIHNLAGKVEYEEKLHFWRERLIQELEGREEEFTDGNKLIIDRH